jgi:soluble lytic murein transglycosylase
MQLMPATASLIARHKGDTVGSLNDPAVSFEYGQSYLEELASAGGTGGLLPKVIAAYNAGPNNVARWTAGNDDPLLFIESIPFRETRAYVAIVLRNYWIYQRETGSATSSLTAMAQGQWPMFPTRTVQTASAAAATHAPN